MENWRIENIATMACIVLMTLGLYLAGAGGMSFWSMLLMLNLNFPKSTKQ